LRSLPFSKSPGATGESAFFNHPSFIAGDQRSLGLLAAGIY